jgi:hypothetical protein
VPGKASRVAVSHPEEKRSRLGHRVRAAYQRHVDYRRRAAVITLLFLIATFVFLRALTAGIHYHVIPVHDVVTPGGLHVHHFVWGIFVVLLVGFLAISLEQAIWHPRLAVPFGIGTALVLDEFALWLNLEDVYWARQGRESVELVLALAAVLLMYLAVYRFVHALVLEVVKEIRRLYKLRPRRGSPAGEQAP